MLGREKESATPGGGWKLRRCNGALFTGSSSGLLLLLLPAPPGTTSRALQATQALCCTGSGESCLVVSHYPAHQFLSGSQPGKSNQISVSSLCRLTLPCTFPLVDVSCVFFCSPGLPNDPCPVLTITLAHPAFKVPLTKQCDQCDLFSFAKSCTGDTCFLMLLQSPLAHPAF